MDVPRHARSLLILGSLWLASPPAQADFYLVVQAGNPLKSISEKEAVDLYTGRSRAFRTGEFALIFDLPRDSAQHSAFYRLLTGMTPAQINSYWSRLMFSGQTMPPQALPNEQAMIEIVRRNPSAIGYVSREPADRALRTVLVLKEPPAAASR